MDKLAAGISVVIPVFNSEHTLVKLIDRLERVFEPLVDDYEIILVDDGSRDASWFIIEKLSRERSSISGIGLARNFGQHNATLCGLRAATKEITVTLDDDLQHPPEEIPKLLAALQHDVDIVYGKPIRTRQPLYHILLGKLARGVVGIVCRSKVVFDATSFRAFRSSLLNFSSNFSGESVIVDQLLSWGTSRVAAVLVDSHPRAVGRTNYRLVVRGHQVATALASFSTSPLQFASALGLLTAMLMPLGLALCLPLWLIGWKNLSLAVASLVIALVFVVAMVVLSTMGVYLIRLIELASGNPTYIVAKRTSNTLSPPEQTPVSHKQPVASIERE